MALENLKPADGSTAGRKRIGRGQGSGNGKTAGKGMKGQKSRSGYNAKRGFEGGQQPIHRRLPKIGFRSKIVKPHGVNVDRFPKIGELAEITVDALKEIGAAPRNAIRVKLIGSGAKALAAKIKDENVSYSGASNE